MTVSTPAFAQTDCVAQAKQARADYLAEHGEAMTTKQTMTFLSQCRTYGLRKEVVLNAIELEKLRDQLAEQHLILKRNGAIIDLNNREIAKLNRESNQLEVAIDEMNEEVADNVRKAENILRDLIARH